MRGWTLTYLPDTNNIQRMLDCQYFISSRLWHQCNLHFCVQSTQFKPVKPVKGLDPFIVKTLQILMVILSVSTAKQNLFSVWIFISASYRIFLASGELIRLFKLFFPTYIRIFVTDSDNKNNIQIMSHSK